MGALSRPFGRQVGRRNLTPDTPYIAWLVPFFLLASLLVIAIRFGGQARRSFIEAGLEHAQKAFLPVNLVAERPIPEDDLSLFTPEIHLWSAEISRWSDEHNLPPALVALVMQIESCGAPNVESPAGAIGLFQVMPFHFSDQDDPFNPETNAARGLSYLRRAYELGGSSIAKTLAGYNGGHSRINTDPDTWPEETRRYVAWGTGIWEEIQANDARSETLEGWLAAGGSSLCLRAHNDMPALQGAFTVQP